MWGEGLLEMRKTNLDVNLVLLVRVHFDLADFSSAQLKQTTFQRQIVLYHRSLQSDGLTEGSQVGRSVVWVVLG